jgi:hypothetical protein
VSLEMVPATTETVFSMGRMIACTAIALSRLPSVV